MQEQGGDKEGLQGGSGSPGSQGGAGDSGCHGGSGESGGHGGSTMALSGLATGICPPPKKKLLGKTMKYGGRSGGAGPGVRVVPYP